MIRKLVVTFFQNIFGKQRPKDETLTVVPKEWDEYPPKFLLPETEAGYNERAQRFLAEAKERFVTERSEYLRKIDEYKAAKTIYDQTCEAVSAAENTSYPSPLDREITLRHLRSVRDNAECAANILSGPRENSSLEHHYCCTRNSAERVLREQEELKIRNGDVVNEAWSRDKTQRIITCIGSRFFLVRIYHTGSLGKSTFYTDSLAQMTNEELQAIKTYQAAHSERQQIAG